MSESLNSVASDALTLTPQRYVLFGGSGTKAIGPDLARLLPGHLSIIVTTSDSGGSVEQQLGFTEVALSDIAKTAQAFATNEAVNRAIGTGRLGELATLATLHDIRDSLVDAVSTITIDPQTHDTIPALVDKTRAEEMLSDMTAMGQHVIQEQTDLDNHAPINFVLGSLKRWYERTQEGTLATAVAELSRWLGVPKNVDIIPATFEPHELVMQHMTPDGLQTVRSEKKIDKEKIYDLNSVRIKLERPDGRTPDAAPEALQAIDNAHHAIYSIGSPHTSIAPSLGASGEIDALQRLRARKGLVILGLNLTTEATMPTATPLSVVRFIGSHAISPTHLVFNDGEIDTNVIKEGMVPLRYDESLDTNATVIVTNLVGGLALYDPRDKLARSGDRSPLVTNGPRFVEAISPYVRELVAA